MAKLKASFKSVLNYPERLFAIYQHKINQQAQVLRLVRNVLPTKLGSHASYCVLNDKKIVLYTDSATWSSQLRFYHQTILSKLHDTGFQHVEVLQIKVVPEQQTQVSKNKAKIPSQENIDLIRQQGLAQHDQELNAAFLRLSKTLSRLSSDKRK